MRVPMRAEVAIIFVERMLAKFDVPLTFSVEPKIPPAEMFDAMRLEETIFAKLEVPETFSEVILADVPDMVATVILELNRFARLLVPEIFAVVDLNDPVTREVHSKLRTFDVPERFIVDPTS
jgi:hypothetical protein